mmetsp:Transcript_48014/g.104533  ORF Transcript_48014/g.104533 Transcript_48014/m.104533 type:complete len:236 (+) Transcript_48014:390-1097(+)
MPATFLASTVASLQPTTTFWRSPLLLVDDIRVKTLFAPSFCLAMKAATFASCALTATSSSLSFLDSWMELTQLVMQSDISAFWVLPLMRVKTLFATFDLFTSKRATLASTVWASCFLCRSFLASSTSSLNAWNPRESNIWLAAKNCLPTTNLEASSCLSLKPAMAFVAASICSSYSFLISLSLLAFLTASAHEMKVVFSSAPLLPETRPISTFLDFSLASTRYSPNWARAWAKPF